jgi:hypothetical protein
MRQWEQNGEACFQRTDVHGIAIHDHCVQGGLAFLVRGAAPSYAAITALSLALAAALKG